ncbi:MULTISPECIES: alpha/beta fold hydrolase [unclassified Microbacterium]|uniref:alpha/beta fold hydrolase n=1 Tax=unclassified Microbacterium TaxID=2609290 RepID=UPI0012FC18F6|nr:alpha/beta fold hydrolase [Microbacterium sp. MAH-37]MVQ43341.1 alpha/beta fold hydrolase [Microbacterium sp. MAH-37]
MSTTPILFVHGFWHGAWCWTDVLSHCAAAGRVAHAVDLPGHGLRAARPAADIDLDHAADFLVDQIGRLGHGHPVAVVAHSMGGAVLTRAAQQAPDLFAQAIYLAAFMPATDTPAIAYAQSPALAALLLPDVVARALRLNVAPGDVVARGQLRDTFYGDVDLATADAAIEMLNSDAPLSIATDTTTLTDAGWGSVSRTYITTEHDAVIPVGTQRRLIADADAAFPVGPTRVVALDASHSPFLSVPERVAEIVCRAIPV